jgi:polysaccharide export outer membrane protein
VFGEPTLTDPQVHVVPGGLIGLPLAGQIRVGGLTPAQAGRKIEAALSKYVRNPRVTVSIQAVGPVDVLVLGDVKLPGKYTLQAESRVTDAIAAAGGLGPTDGPLPVARLESSDGKITQVSLQGLLHDGDVTQNVHLENEQTVYIPSPNIINVQVLGAVDHPGDVALHEGDRLTMAIARAGDSPNAQSDLNHVQVRRILPDGAVQSTTVNLYDVLKSGDLSKDMVMQKGDLVMVPQGAGRQDRVSPATGILYLVGRLMGLGL